MKTLTCHKMVKEVAEALCRTQYELSMKEDDIWKQWQKSHPGKTGRALEDAFVEHFLSDFIEPARATMTEMLNGHLADNLKEQIADALIKDKSLARNRPGKRLFHV